MTPTAGSGTALSHITMLSHNARTRSPQATRSKQAVAIATCTQLRHAQVEDCITAFLVGTFEDSKSISPQCRLQECPWIYPYQKRLRPPQQASAVRRQLASCGPHVMLLFAPCRLDRTDSNGQKLRISCREAAPPICKCCDKGFLAAKSALCWP